MAAPTDIRKWAKDRGIEVPARGPLPAAVIEDYESNQPPPDLPPVEPAAADVADAAPPPGMSERAPRVVAGPARGRGLAAAVRDKTKRGEKTDKARPRVSTRVPVDKLISAAWRGLASFARPIPPTSRLLRLQAPVAGLLLEDVVKGTVIDRVLQPLARAEEGGKVVGALIGPPVLVTMIAMQPSAIPILLPLLRESLLMWCEVAGPMMEKAVQREADFEERYGQDVDQMIELILSAAPTNLAEKAADDERIADFVSKAARR